MKKMSIGKRILAVSAFTLVLSSVAMATPNTRTVDISPDELECRTVSWYSSVSTLATTRFAPEGRHVGPSAPPPVWRRCSGTGCRRAHPDAIWILSCWCGSREPSPVAAPNCVPTYSTAGDRS